MSFHLSSIVQNPKPTRTSHCEIPLGAASGAFVLGIFTAAWKPITANPRLHTYPSRAVSNQRCHICNVAPARTNPPTQIQSTSWGQTREENPKHNSKPPEQWSRCGASSVYFYIQYTYVWCVYNPQKQTTLPLGYLILKWQDQSPQPVLVKSTKAALQNQSLSHLNNIAIHYGVQDPWVHMCMYLCVTRSRTPTSYKLNPPSSSCQRCCQHKTNEFVKTVVSSPHTSFLLRPLGPTWWKWLCSMRSN